MAVLAIAYAGMQFWFDAMKRKQTNAHIAAAFNADPKKDMIGNEKISDFTARTGITVARAVAV
jgi:hypothetical protein